MSYPSNLTRFFCPDSTYRKLTSEQVDLHYAFEDYWVTKEFESVPVEPTSIIRLGFADKNESLVIYEPKAPVPIGSAPWNPWSSSKTIRVTDSIRTMLVDPEENQEWFRIGLPFFGQHVSQSDPWTGDSHCVKTYLTVGAPITNDGEENKGHLFIVRWSTTITPGRCDHRIDKNATMTHSVRNVAALLAGWQNTSSSLGTLLTISSDGRRIAAATWDRVLLWTIDPDMLSQGPFDPYFPPRDYNARKGFGRIRSVRLPSQGIVYSLHWYDNENLFAVTDHGLVKWYIGALGTGRRENDFSPFYPRKRLKSITDP